MLPILNTCYKCNGTGVWVKNHLDGDIIHDPCPVCAGKKFLPISFIDTSGIESKINTLLREVRALKKK